MGIGIHTPTNLSNYVPYLGATQSVNIYPYDITANNTFFETLNIGSYGYEIFGDYGFVQFGTTGTVPFLIGDGNSLVLNGFNGTNYTSYTKLRLHGDCITFKNPGVNDYASILTGYGPNTTPALGFGWNADPYGFFLFDISNGVNNFNMKTRDMIFMSSSINNGFVMKYNTGRIGIGTNAPSVLLDVNGTANATAYKVGGVSGVSGSFTTVDFKTVTITNGLITSIV